MVFWIPCLDEQGEEGLIGNLLGGIEADHESIPPDASALCAEADQEPSSVLWQEMETMYVPYVDALFPRADR